MNKFGKLGAVCAAGVLSSAMAVGAIRSITPVMWEGDTNCWQLVRHRGIMAQVKNGGAKVVFIGASITHFWETVGYDVWQAHLSKGDRRVLNLGVSGDRTEHVLWRIANGELDGYEAKVIFLKMGSNNAGHMPFSKEPPVDTILGIREILAKIQEKQPKAIICLLATYPRGYDVTDPVRVRNELVNKEVHKFCDGKKIFWINFNDQFMTADGHLPREYFPDLLHPAKIGYEIWYSAIKPYIDYALSDGSLPAPANRYSTFVPRENVRMNEPVTVYPASRIRGEGYGEKDWWLNRLLRNRNQIVDSNEAIDLVFFGDSITHNWDNAPGKNQLAKLRETYSVLNIGYSGDRTEQLVWRGENGELDGYKAKCIMLMIGTNNTREKAEDVAAGIKKILEVIARKQPQAKTLLLPIFPRDKPNSELRAKNAKVNEIIRGYADGDKVIWLDFTSQFLDKDGDVEWIMPDRLHPQEKGYDIWMNAALPYFKTICGK